MAYQNGRPPNRRSPVRRPYPGLSALLNMAVQRIGATAPYTRPVTTDLEQEIKLNFGGTAYLIRPKTVLRRPGITRLHKFVLASHGERAQMADSYIYETAEYFFERSPQTFDPIYQYFVSGNMHKPQRMCSMDFRHELMYWQIPIAAVSHCCRQQMEKDLRFLTIHESDEEMESSDDLNDDQPVITDNELGYNSSLDDHSEFDTPPPATMRRTMKRQFRRRETTVPTWMSNKGLVIRNVSQEEKKAHRLSSAAAQQGHCSYVRFIVWRALTRPELTLTGQVFAIVSMIVVFCSCANFVIESCLVRVREETGGGGGQGDIYDVTTHDDAASSAMFTIGETDIRVSRLVIERVELFCTLWFAVEFSLKLLSCPDKVAFLRTFGAWVDLMSALPFFIERTISSFAMNTVLKSWRHTLVVLRVLRITRLLRLFKFGRYSEGLHTFAVSITAIAPHLIALSFISFIWIILFGTIQFFVEGEVEQAGGDNQFVHIPAALWWAWITFSRVGYGDIVPHTFWGKFLAMWCVFAGVLVLALPIPVMVGRWIDTSNKKRAVAHARRVKADYRKFADRRRHLKAKRKAADPLQKVVKMNSRLSQQGYRGPGRHSQQGAQDDTVVDYRSRSVD